MERKYLGSITPINVSVFVEDGVPYLNYTGRANVDDGEVEIHIPKIDLTFNELVYEEEYAKDRHGTIICPIKWNCHVVQQNDRPGIYFDYKILKRNMTKAAIEKALGYKINII